MRFTRLVDRWHGVVLTLLSLTAYYLFTTRSPETNLSLALIYIPIVYSAYTSGLIAGLISATLMLLYGWFILNLPLGRISQTIVSIYFIVYIIGVLKSRSFRRDTIESIVIKLYEALGALREIRSDAVFEALPLRIKQSLDIAEDRVGNLAARSHGWQQLLNNRNMLLKEEEDEQAKQDDKPGRSSG